MLWSWKKTRTLNCGTPGWKKLTRHLALSAKPRPDSLLGFGPGHGQPCGACSSHSTSRTDSGVGGPNLVPTAAPQVPVAPVQELAPLTEHCGPRESAAHPFFCPHHLGYTVLPSLDAFRGL